MIAFSDLDLEEECNPVTNPKHYQVFMKLEAIDIIKVVLNSPLTKDMTPFQISCFKDVLKYRLRAGEKDDLEQDINKANQYKAMAND